MTKKSIQTMEASMNLSRLIPLLSFLITVGGCAASDLIGEPIVDMKGVDPSGYQTDLAECKSYAKDVDVQGRTLSNILKGAFIGGIFGAIFDSGLIDEGAGLGGVSKGSNAHGDAILETDQVLRNCLNNRGYVILN
jgi:outer membrane lipoprotein SlyB